MSVGCIHNALYACSTCQALADAQHGVIAHSQLRGIARGSNKLRKPAFPTGFGLPMPKGDDGPPRLENKPMGLKK